MDDGELLNRYVAAGSEEAFGSLVERNLPLVYSVALRKTNNPSMAEDVTQVVFIILAKKAHEFSKDIILAGWLHRTAYHVSMKVLVKECRRRRREEKAVQMQTIGQDADWESLSPVLDDALAQLGEAERSAVVMRYFQNRSFQEVGDALGVSDDTAQKKVSRSVDKLRKIFYRRGVAISTVGFAGLTATRAAQFAPETLAERIIPAALKGTGVSSAVHALLVESIKPVLTLKLVGAWTAATAAGLAVIAWAAHPIGPHATAAHHPLPQSSEPPLALQQPTAPLSVSEPKVIGPETNDPAASRVVLQTPAPIPAAEISVPPVKVVTSQPPVTPLVAQPNITAPVPSPVSSYLPPVVVQNPAPVPDPIRQDFSSPTPNGTYQGPPIILPQYGGYGISVQKRGSNPAPAQQANPPPPSMPTTSGTIRRRF